MTCAEYEFGFYAAYRHLAERDDLDAVLHLGDYIYEFGNNYGPLPTPGEEIGRVHEPPSEIVSLADYRTRYGQYRSDPDLQALHAAHPVIVIYDDHDLPWTALRIRQRGSAGGHHGMESVIRAIGSEDFTRVRLGIDSGTGRPAEPDFLLRPLRREQKQELDGFLDYAAQAVETIISEGAEKAMTRFNRRARGVKQEES